MSWYVKFLLLNSREIKEKILNPFSSQFSATSSDEPDEYSFSYAEDISDFAMEREVPSPEDDDFFNDLLVVEKEINELHKKGILTGRDLDLIDSMILDSVFSNLGIPLGRGRLSITDRFNTICNLLSKSLGGVFTNKGYVEYLTDKYRLSNEKVKVLEQFIENNSKI